MGGRDGTVGDVLRTRTVAAGPPAVVRAVECTDHHLGWSAPEVSVASHFVLVRQGRFQLQARGRCLTVDPTSGYFQQPGQEVRFSHPVGGDRCTSITLPDVVVTEGIAEPPTPAVRVDSRLELAHRMLLRSTADPDFAAVEAVVALL